MAYELRALIEKLKPVTFIYNFKDETPARIDRFLDEVATLKQVDGYENLSFYDSSYLFFAKQRGLTLVTDDKKLELKAKKHLDVRTYATLFSQ